MKRLCSFLLALLALTVLDGSRRGGGAGGGGGGLPADGEDHREVLYAVNEHEPLEPASVTKIMTILLVMEAIDSGQLQYGDVVTPSAHACSMAAARSG